MISARCEIRCARCPLARRCWGSKALPVEGMRGRPQPLLERGARLICQGEESRSVYLVVAGCLILRETTAEGTERTIGFRFPGEVVGLEGWASGSQSFTAIATDATSVCRVAIAPAGRGYSSAALLEQLLVKCTIRLERSKKLWRGLPAVELVAAFLEDFAQRTRVNASVTDLRSLPMTRADIGSCLGLAEETVVRALTELRSRKGAQSHR
jgi:CRP/FNR family transcriptional regulator, anaerobic regulatory protein